MTTPSGGRIGFEATFGNKAQGQRRTDTPTFSVLVLADFSARSTVDAPPSLASRIPKRVDIDNLDQVFEGFGSTLELSPPNSAGAAVSLTVRSLDDFHPDWLLKRVPFLFDLVSARSGLTQPGDVTAAAEKLAAILKVTAPAAPSSPDEGADEASPQTPTTESDNATLDRLLGKSPSAAPAAPKPSPLSAVEKLIHQAVESSGSITPTAPSGTDGLISAADLELSTRLRSILHHQDFQSLEAAWRSLDFLVRRCPDEERVQFSVLDVTLDELTADIEGLKRLLRDTPPDLVVGDYTFGQTKAGLDALGGLAALCSEIGTRFVAGAHPNLAGCDSFAVHPDPDDWQQQLPAEVAESWSTLQSSSAATCVGLALPRFLLRQPYGKGSDPIETFGFEEIVATRAHEAFLWGNPAVACAQVLSETFVAEAEGMEVGEGGEVDDLPVFRLKEEGESAMKPCAEAWLSDRAAETLLRRGLTPVLSIKGRNAVRVATLVSIANQG